MRAPHYSAWHQCAQRAPRQPSSAATLSPLEREASAALPLAQRLPTPLVHRRTRVLALALPALLTAGSEGCAAPFALQIAGRWSEAAAAWAASGLPVRTSTRIGRRRRCDAQREALATLRRNWVPGPQQTPCAGACVDAGVRGVARAERPDFDAASECSALRRANWKSCDCYARACATPR